MFDWKYLKSALRVGLLLGLIFGLVNLAFSWLYPLEDDTIGVLLRFYGPMFLAWAFASFRAARRDGKLLSGVATGLIVAFATFCVFDVLNFVRINVFLYELTGRADWQNMMARFRASDYDSLRTFVTLEAIKATPLLIGVGSVIGAVMGTVGGLLGCLSRGSRPQLPDTTLQPLGRK
jgi:uncharacterized membrane protein (UPF0136 family)